MNKKLLAALLLCPALLVGCATNSYTDGPPSLGVMYSKYAYIGYSGEEQPIEDVGIVTTDGLIKVKSVDGYSVNSLKLYKSSGLYSGGRYQLHLLPGTHELVLGFHEDRGDGHIAWSTSDLTKSITIDKGQVIHLSLGRDGRTWNALQTDGKSAIATIVSDFKDLSKNK